MSLNSLFEFTISAGAHEINTNLHAIATPTSMMFDMPENQHNEQGAKIDTSLLYKDENTQVVRDGLDTYMAKLIDPYAHVNNTWAYRVVTLTLNGKEIQQNLGGFTLDQLIARGANIISALNQNHKNLLIDMISPRFANLKQTMDKNIARNFFEHVINPDGKPDAAGIDQITEPDSTYAGLSYDSLEDLPFRSDLLKLGTSGSGAAAMWNPITRDLGSSQMEWKHIQAAASDMQKGMNYGIREPNSAKGWTKFFMSPARYNHSPMMTRFDDQRRRMESGDVEISPTDALIDSRLGAKFYEDPNILDDGIVYFWHDDAIQLWQQIMKTFLECMKTPRLSVNQDIVNIIIEKEYQYMTTKRWMTGYIRTNADVDGS